jgi:hypothetical protein
LTKRKRDAKFVATPAASGVKATMSELSSIAQTTSQIRRGMVLGGKKPARKVDGTQHGIALLAIAKGMRPRLVSWSA